MSSTVYDVGSVIQFYPIESGHATRIGHIGYAVVVTKRDCWVVQTELRAVVTQTGSDGITVVIVDKARR